MPAVSVIMAAYNVEPYLGAALLSVLAQTFRDIELIVIDDGSTDQSHQLATAYAARDPRVRVLHKVNGGISSARNHGLQVATGQFIAFIDSDDIWDPEFLQAQLDVLAARPDIDLVTGNAWELGGPLSGHPARPVPDPRPAPDLLSIIEDENAVFIMTVFRRQVYETIGGFDEELRTNEDYDFWLRAATAGFRFARNDRPLAHYRRRADSLSAAEVQMIRGILRVYRKLRAHLVDRPEYLAAIDAQTVFFERERLAAEARDAMISRNSVAARASLAAWHAADGGLVLGLARFAARWTPGILWRAYQLHRNRLKTQADLRAR
ncbi:MAG: glycosyltransferase [Acidobacteriota bacterium]|nr:glycosyltransferase [Acidobacteriota bacterium]